MPYKLLLPFTVLILFNLHTFADQVSLQDLARQNQMPLELEGGVFSGPGWDHIREQVLSSQNVLFGEDHFTNEIPLLISAIGKLEHFDHFVIEVDPYSADIFERTLALPRESRDQFNATYGDLYSFYALVPEYELLEQMVAAGVHLLGTDQVALFADPLVFQEWRDKSGSPEARAIYDHMIAQSAVHLAQFLGDTEKKLYFLTPEFSEKLDELSTLDITDEERQLISDVRRSVDIYLTQSHRKRITLMKHNLMQYYPQWKDKKNLFKFGGNHLMRGESWLTVQDTGALVANLTEANFQTSFHILVLGESGQSGSPFRSFPPTPVDANDFFLKPLKPFFDLTEGKSWHVFNLLPLRKSLERGELVIDDVNLARTIKGYDTLVLIPALTPAAFPSRSSGGRDTGLSRSSH